MIARLLAGAATTIKRGLDEPEARWIDATMQTAGATVRVEEESEQLLFHAICGPRVDASRSPQSAKSGLT